MRTTLLNFGNNQGIYIPYPFITALDLKLNEPLEINVYNNQIIIEKIKMSPEKALYAGLAFGATPFLNSNAHKTNENDLYINF